MSHRLKVVAARLVKGISLALHLSTYLERNRIILFVNPRGPGNNGVIIINGAFTGNIIEEIITRISELGELADKFQIDCAESSVSVLRNYDFSLIF